LVKGNEENEEAYKGHKVWVRSDINRLVCNWFCTAQSKIIPLTGKLIQEKAFSQENAQNMSNFNASLT